MALCCLGFRNYYGIYIYIYRYRVSHGALGFYLIKFQRTRLLRDVTRWYKGC